jgi:hypothetical protein
MRLAAQAHLSARPLHQVSQYSASPTDFILPFSSHMMRSGGNPRGPDVNDWEEHDLYLGFVVLALAGAGILSQPRTSSQRKFSRLLIFTGLFALLLALGTSFHWLGQPVSVSIPWLGIKTPIVLPGMILFKYLPFYAQMRVWMRYGIYIVLIVSVLAGMGTAALLESKRKFLKVTGTVLLLIFVFVDFYPGTLTMTRIRNRSVDVWLAANPDSGAVAQFPVWQMVQGPCTYYSLINNKPYIGAFLAGYLTPQFIRIRPTLESFPSKESTQLLKELGVHWVIVDTTEYEHYSEVREKITSLNLRWRGQFDTQGLFELR